MNNTYNADGLGTQVTQVGADFPGGAEGSAEIYQMLGTNAGVYGGKLMCEAEPEWVECPNHCEDEEACRDLLAERGVAAYAFPTVDVRKRKPKDKPFVEEFVAVFSVDGKNYFTVALPTRAEALACTLWFVLSK